MQNNDSTGTDATRKVRQGRTLPSKAAIARYWSELDTMRHLDWDYPGCFACNATPGWTTPAAATIEKQWEQLALERAHLIPHSEGGTASVENLVLLCRRCHREAPMVGRSARPMIEWINRRESELSHVCRRIIEECVAIDPDFYKKIEGTVYVGVGETFAEEMEDFIRKAMLMARFLKIGIHPGGDVISTAAALVCAMGEFPKWIVAEKTEGV